MSGVLEKHPNLSVFHDDDDTENKPTEVPFPAPSPPSSPSKSRHGVLRRMSRSGKHDNGEPSKVSSALKLPLRLPKKVKSHMSIHTNGKRIPREVIGTAHQGNLQCLKSPSAPPTRERQRHLQFEVRLTLRDAQRHPWMADTALSVPSSAIATHRLPARASASSPGTPTES
jgi:hypothetical protein